MKSNRMNHLSNKVDEYSEHLVKVRLKSDRTTRIVKKIQVIEIDMDGLWPLQNPLPGR